MANLASTHNAANFVPLSPISFLRRAATFFAERPAIIYQEKSWTYAQFYGRVTRLANALRSLNVEPGDRVALLIPNIPQMLEAHYAIPMIGAVLTPLNIGAEASVLGEQLRHSGAKLLIVDEIYLALAQQAQETAEQQLPIVLINEREIQAPREPLDYESMVKSASEEQINQQPTDEMQPISLLYTSGTTGPPKAIVHVHRGAYLAGMANALSFGLNHNSVHLWTWPMFHSNGLSFVWAVTAAGGVHVCLRDLHAPTIFKLITRHHVTDFSLPPSVLNRLANDESADGARFSHSVRCITGGAPPPSATISHVEKLGIEVIHQYGSSECYGPATVAWRRPEWDVMSFEQRATLMARQGTPTPVVDDLMVADPLGMRPVTKDGSSLGEVMLRGNTVMQGYFSDDMSSSDPLAGGWFHTGDMAVWHADGTVEIKDRATDVINPDGDVMSSVEIEDVLHMHPVIQEAAVVGLADKAAGEVPCAFVTTVRKADANATELANFCRDHLSEAQIPRKFVFGDLPKTQTGKVKKYELREMVQQLADAEC